MLLVSLVYVLRFSLRKLLKVCPFDKKTSVQLSQTSVHRRYALNSPIMKQPYLDLKTPISNAMSFRGIKIFLDVITLLVLH